MEYCLPVGFELERPGFVEPGFDRALVIALDALGFEIDDRPLACGAKFCDEIDRACVAELVVCDDRFHFVDAFDIGVEPLANRIEQDANLVVLRESGGLCIDLAGGVDAAAEVGGFRYLLAHVVNNAACKLVVGLVVQAGQGERGEDALLDAPGIESGLGEHADDVGHRGIGSRFAGVSECDRAKPRAVCTLDLVIRRAVRQIPMGGAFAFDEDHGL